MQRIFGNGTTVTTLSKSDAPDVAPWFAQIDQLHDQLLMVTNTSKG